MPRKIWITEKSEGMQTGAMRSNFTSSSPVAEDGDCDVGQAVLRPRKGLAAVQTAGCFWVGTAPTPTESPVPSWMEGTSICSRATGGAQ